MYLIGASVLSALRPGKPQADSRVRAWAATLPQSGFFPSASTVLEHEIGIVRSSVASRPRAEPCALGGTLLARHLPAVCSRAQ